MSVHSFLPVVIGIPTLIVTLLWLLTLNFKDFRDGWPFVAAQSAGLCRRVYIHRHGECRALPSRLGIS